MRLLLLFLLLPLLSTGQPETDTYRLFYLGGQSNMNGYGYNSELPDSLNKTFDDVWIFQGNPAPDDTTSGGKGLWAPLKPGHGKDFTSDGTTNNRSDRFGVELAFAAYLQSQYPQDKIALIKYAKGGSSIDSIGSARFGCWDPDYGGKNTPNQYDYFLKTTRSALAVKDINSDGTPDKLIPSGIVWMQGESDADFTEAVALRYYGHLKRLMDLIRAAFRADDLPVVIGKISDSWDDEEDGKVWNYGELVQYAQEKYARQDANAAIVRQTRYYGYSDTWHYDTEGYIDLGKRFAQKLMQLRQDR